MITTRRAYDPHTERDGERILVDRLWPRGLKKEALHLSSWIKDLSPTTDLRKWFDHDPSRWEEFRRRYERELQDPEKQAIPRDIGARSRHGVVTLVFGAKDEDRNNAVVLKNLIERIAKKTAW